ncbi:SusD/RagB family nutrient-binding outer membrane lipoprotein [Deminuibacter soli]|uniref:SusD/RagB family nutrient-binding outer membrane lipoprotein n=1 Tax=Deminuibacter soli TaxID=2291815 RepID=A0A3E1NDD8_9BACT|nr:SusD/RagB family nutrient-binding outer membrane lipoprotein [Deminuibacter soli]RFM25985.1 SusD/RagB family nutrient-binding outer membrane lipoprotein [Deminuibacter soli]
MQFNIMNIKTLLGVALLSVLLAATGCQKHLDINQDPNNPSLEQGTPFIVFPAAVLGTAGAAGDLGILGGLWAEHFTQSAIANQYIYIDAYNVKTADLNGPYTLLFANGLKNYQYVIDKARAASDWTFYLLGWTMKAYTAGELVDLYDKIPYTEALAGTSNLQPKFDDGYAIYQDLIKGLDSALGKDFSARTSTIFTPSNANTDLLFNGNLDKWIAFANTMKLKLYLRMVNAHADVAQAGITDLLSSGATFLTNNAGVTTFTDAPGLDNPMYEQNIRQLNTGDNLRASTTFLSWLIANSDPRIVSYFGSTGATSLDQGDRNGNTAATVFVQSATDPVLFLSKAESYFLQAEADVRYGDGSHAQSLYNQGVLQAFTDVGQDGTSFVAPGGAYEFPTGGSTEDKIEAIIVQKWASFAYGTHQLEAFFDKNRTGYPKTSPVYSNAINYVPGQIVVSASTTLAAGLLPKRLVYPYVETSRNANAPALVPISTPVWWGK